MLSMADDSCPGQVERTAGETCGIQRWLGALSDAATSQTDPSQPGIAGEEAILKKAIVQLQVDIRAEAFQVELAGDPGAPKSQPMWIGVGREPSTQDVPDHGRPAGPVITPRSHRRLISHLTAGGQVEPFASVDVLDQ